LQNKLRDKKRELGASIAKAYVSYKKLITTDHEGNKVTWVFDEKENEVIIK
jgi:hypothetical protein